MKHIKKVKIPSSTEEQVFKVTCDICGNEIIEKGYIDNEVTISHKVGMSYSDGGNGEVLQCDICSDCFTAKVVPAIESLGVKFHKEKYDW